MNKGKIQIGIKLNLDLNLFFVRELTDLPLCLRRFLFELDKILDSLNIAQIIIPRISLGNNVFHDSRFRRFRASPFHPLSGRNAILDAVLSDKSDILQFFFLATWLFLSLLKYLPYLLKNLWLNFISKFSESSESLF